MGSKNIIEVRNPYNNETVGTVPVMKVSDVDSVVDTVKEYDFSLSGFERYEILASTASALREERDSYAQLITSEIGISLKDSLHEVDRSINFLILVSEEAKRIGGEVLPSEISPGTDSKMVVVMREPVGRVCCITPFNHPLNQVVSNICPAIAANNAVVLKPSEKSPLTALRFAELLVANGLPKTMLQVVTGFGADIGQPLIQHPGINMVNFTGSTQVGELITRSCGVKKLSLELGGNDVLIVAPDADIENAAQVAAAGAFQNSGQRCSSIKRIITFPENATAFSKALVEVTKRIVVGDPADISTDIGTVINEEAAQAIEAKVIEAEQGGAKILIGGKRKEAVFWPTVLDYVSPNSRIVADETFGPVAPIIRAADFDEAINIANATHYGLNGGIMTNNLELAFKFARHLNVGGIRINQAPSFRNEFVPFGGNKNSGFGRTSAKYAILEMTNHKSIIFS